MEIKKDPKYNLENYSASFLGIGFVIALIFVYVVIEWKTYEKSLLDLGEVDFAVEEEETIITKEDRPKPPPPPPPSAPEQILVVDNDKVLELELDLQAEEFDEEEVVDIEIEEEEVDIPVALVEEKPVFPGCEKYKTKEEQFACMNKKIFEHVRKEFEYPEMAREMGIQGRVQVKFVINKKGNIDNIQVVRGIDKNLDAEAARIIEKLKSKIVFKPAKQGDKAVNVSYVLPITFKLQ